MIQGTEKWHAWRKEGIGGSDAPVVMGFSPWKTRLQLWREKITGEIEDLGHLPQIIRGRENEAKARAWAEHHLGCALEPLCLEHPKWPQLRASFDGLNPKLRVGIEIKCPKGGDHATARRGKIPEKYIWQLRHLMLVGNLDQIHYISFDGSSGVVVTLARSDEEEQKLLTAEFAFWQSILDGIPPEFTDKDKMPACDAVWIATARAYLEAKRSCEVIEKRCSILKDRLISLAGDRASVEGGGIEVVRSLKKGQVDYEKIPELRGVDLELYRKLSSVVLSVREKS